MTRDTENPDAARLPGTWRLVAFESEEQASGARRQMFGKQPKGRLVLQENGLMIAILTAEGRGAPATQDERANAFNTMVAYSGRYRVEGERFSTDVDISWNEGWVGTLQVRTWRLVGSRLQFISAWAPSALDPGVIGRGILEWEREA